MRTVAIRSLLTALVLAFTACVSKAPFYGPDAHNWEQKEPSSPNNVLYTVFLVGDVGAPELDKQEPTLKLMRQHMDKAGVTSTTIFLGDNVYHNGLPEPGKYDREISEKRLNAQLDVLKGYPGEKYMIPGNHDWNHSGRGGLEAIMREQVYVNNYLTEENIVVGGDFFVPGNGCPGPYEVKIYDDLVLIAIDSEWWLHPFERPYGDNSGCGAATEADFLMQLEDIIEKNSGSDILVVGHHPLASNGAHGGFFTLKDHIFPFTMLRDWIYLPMPVIGSIYPFARKYGGILQDIPHPRYQAYIQGLMNIFDKYENIVYAAGHEHALEYFKINNLPQIVSGSGCKIQYTKTTGGGNGATYVQSIQGFAKLLYYENGEVWTEFWVPEGNGSTGRVTFRTPLYAKKPRPEVPLVEDKTNYADSTITLAANQNYKAGGLRKALLGGHYRKEWTTPVTVPFIDLGTEKGGLRPYQKGGGKQTATLKVRNEEAEEYVLRTVNKDPTTILPEYLRETAVKPLLQDQISAQHPYGALAIPPLSNAAGVYHTNPELVYIPNTPLLRQYLDEFGNTLAFFEEDADENHETVASLGYAQNLVGTDKVFREVSEDNDNVVDEQAFARARLFDMLIGDWDRHEGQWRWKEEDLDPEPGKRYTPVPEDRDQAFFKADGIVPWLATRKWGVRNIQNFGYDFNDIVGLNLSALSLDRAFTSKLTRADWIRHAEAIKASMTDSVIREAINQWPENIRVLSGETIAAKLKARSQKLPQAAEAFYEHISKVVDVTGSDKHEHFMVNRLDNERTQVTVLKITKEGEVRDTIFNRTFYFSETKELRLYGQGGQDIFDVTGEVSRSPLIRIIGGNGEDVITDNSHVRGQRKRTVVYDTHAGNTFSFGPETKDRTAEFPDVNIYNRNEYKIPYIGPRLSAEYNVDDGLFLGAGLLLRTYNFRNTPYAAEHLLEANFAFLTNSYNIRYTADINKVFGDWGLNINTYLQGPQYQRNFYGFGNRTKQSQEQDVGFYRVRYQRQAASVALSTDFSSFLKLGIGPTFERFKVDKPDAETFLLSEAKAGNLKPGTFNAATGEFNALNYAGATAFANVIVFGGDEEESNPRIGMRFLNSISYNRQLGAEHLHYMNLSSEFSFYVSPSFPFQLTWAGRVGGAHNFGNFRFYQANTLGGTENLRGFRRTRFAGRSVMYANGEARIGLADLNLLVSRSKLGILGHIDAGRIVHDNEPKQGFIESFHTGVGGGLWLDLLKNKVVTFTYTIGEDDKLFALDFGFLF